MREMKKALIAAACLALLAGCGQQTAETTTPPQTPPPVQSVAPSQTPTPDPTPTPSEEYAMVGIPGSHIKDIQLSVASYGMDDDSAQGAPDGAPYRWTASKSWEFPGSTILLDYSIIGDDDSQLISGSFGATWDGITSTDIFKRIAADYLGFIATLPYDTSDTQAAKQWVLEQMETVAGSDPVSKTIGDATFTLSGSTAADGDTPSFYLLQIQAVSSED